MPTISYSAESDRQARFRLAQSRYFLELLRGTGGAAPAFSFHLHALVSAARSITWVLKADFSHLAEFDDWWASERFALEHEELPFRLIADMRNSLEKEGSAIPTRAYIADFPDGPVEYVAYLWGSYGVPPEPFPGHIIASVLVKTGMLASFVRLRDSDPRAAAIRDCAEHSRPQAIMDLASLSGETAKRMDEEGLRPTFRGFFLGPRGGRIYSFDEIVSSFGRYLDRVEALLDRADSSFPQNKRISVHFDPAH